MLNFENNNIFTGYLKQFLASFNLPKYRIYTSEFAKYKQETGKEDPRVLESFLKNSNTEYPELIRDVPYIKDNVIQRYIKGRWVPSPLHYHYNKKELNYTKNLKIKNNLYDSYTHEYLGDFLRFQRDYNNFNLMPLYNCFSNNLCSNLNFSITNKNKKIIFDSSDNNYKIYMLPVKFFNEYTIALDCNSTFELCCGFFDKYINTKDKYINFSSITYENYTNSQFNKPFVYKKLTLDFLTTIKKTYNVD